MVTRPRRECKYCISNYQKAMEGKLVVSDQRHFIEKASIAFADISAEVEIDQPKSARKLAQAHEMSTKR